MSRDIPFDPKAICDICGNKGAFDFMGDLICPECLAEDKEEEEEDKKREQKKQKTRKKLPG